MKRIPTLLLIIAAIYALWPIVVLTQDLECATRTGSNATIIFPEAVSADVDGYAIAAGSRLTAHGEDGRCVGELIWTDEAQALTVWGQETMGAPAGGLHTGEDMTFRLYDSSDATRFHELSLTFVTDSDMYEHAQTYVDNGIYMVEAVRSHTVRVEGKALSSPSPNPFSNQTNIDLTLERSQHVEIQLYNVLGARVADLHEGWLTEGENTLHLDIPDLASGTYFIVARGDDFHHTRQVALIR